MSRWAQFVALGLGQHSWGNSTEQEAVENIRTAIQEYLAARDELLQGTTIREIDVAV